MRLKKYSYKKKIIIGKKIQQICKKNNVKFLVNDNPELSKKLKADEVPGIAFLSGGQSEIEATENLNLINKNNNTNFIMTYSYGRALQQSALKFWSKDIKDSKGTQNIFNHRAKMNTLAAQGKWSSELENK